MTVSSQTNNETFFGNGVTTVWDLPFRFFENADIFAYLINPVTNTTTPLFLGTDYTLTGAGLPEQFGTAPGKITTTTPVVAPRQLYVERILDIEQLTDIVNQGRFFPEVHEDVFDRLTMLIQQLNSDSKGAIRVAIGDPEPARLVSALQRANLLMGFDANGDPTVVAPSSGSATDLSLLLANEVDPAKGAAVIGRGGQVVSSIASLKGLNKASPSKNAFVTGYYAAGDGGGGHYYLDAADVTSVDNGGTIIVATDGGRWKLAATTFVSVKQFGAKGDNVTIDTARVQAAISWAIPKGLRVYLPAGQFVIDGTGLLLDGVGAGTTGGSPAIIYRTGIFGDGQGTSILRWAGGAAQSCLKIITGGSSRSLFENFSILNNSGSKVGYGLVLSQTAHSEFKNVAFEGFEYGVKGDDNFSIVWNTCRFANNTYGCHFTFVFVSRPNDFAFNSCNWISNTIHGGYFQNPTNLNIQGGSIEGCGTAVVGRGAIKIDGNPVDGIVGLMAHGIYFENNAGSFDIGINNSASGGIHGITGCTFNRVSNTNFTTTNISVIQSVATWRTLVSVDRCGFAGFGTYVADPTRKYIQVPAPVDNNWCIDLGQNIWGSSVEIPTVGGARASDSGVGASVRFNGTTATITGTSINVASIVRNGVGDYTINYAKPLKLAANSYAAGISDSTCWFELFSESTSTVRIKTKNASNVYADFTNLSFTVYGTDGGI